MTLAFDAATDLGTGTSTLSATHTPVGTPKAVIVSIATVAASVSGANAVTGVSSVTYGGTNLTQIASANYYNFGEPVFAEIYFLGASIPTGAQTAQVNVSDAKTKTAACVTLTAAADTTASNGTPGTTGASTNGCTTATTGVTGASYGFAVLATGFGGLTTTATGWTQSKGVDHGSYVSQHWYENSEGTGNPSYTVPAYGAADETAHVVIAVQEAGSTPSGDITTTWAANPWAQTVTAGVEISNVVTTTWAATPWAQTVNATANLITADVAMAWDTPWAQVVTANSTLSGGSGRTRTFTGSGI